MLTRRSLLAAASAERRARRQRARLAETTVRGGIGGRRELSPGVPAGIASYATMATLPGKKPLIRLSDRGPNYEAPLEYFRTPITPNDEFFVRYHLSDIPEVDAKTYKIEVGGDGANGQTESPLTISRRCRRSKWSRSINAPATGAACPIRTSPASNGATAPWAARAGRARVSRTCSTWSA